MASNCEPGKKLDKRVFEGLVRVVPNLVLVSPTPFWERIYPNSLMAHIFGNAFKPPTSGVV